MKTNYVLIDFENVQPKNLSILKDMDFKVILFVGANQTKISFDLASAMQELGSSAQYVKIDGNGPNALDFHIAYYIGQISATDKDSYFHIISKDKGFDPLIKHLKSKKIYAMREKSIAEIPLVNLSATKSKEERIKAIIDHLISRGNGRPRKLKTLSNVINNLFYKRLKDNEISALIEQLIKQSVVVQKDSKISYNLPS